MKQYLNAADPLVHIWARARHVNRKKPQSIHTSLSIYVTFVLILKCGDEGERWAQGNRPAQSDICGSSVNILKGQPQKQSGQAPASTSRF